MKTLTLLCFSLLLFGCGDSEQKVSGGTSNTLDVEQTAEPVAAKLNGIIYVKGETIKAGKITSICIAIDTTSLYSETFVPLVEFDAARADAYTTEEIAKCAE